MGVFSDSYTDLFGEPLEETGVLGRNYEDIFGEPLVADSLEPPPVEPISFREYRTDTGGPAPVEAPVPQVEPMQPESFGATPEFGELSRRINDVNVHLQDQGRGPLVRDTSSRLLDVIGNYGPDPSRWDQETKSQARNAISYIAPALDEIGASSPVDSYLKSLEPALERDVESAFGYVPPPPKPVSLKSLQDGGLVSKSALRTALDQTEREGIRVASDDEFDQLLSKIEVTPDRFENMILGLTEEDFKQAPDAKSRRELRNLQRQLVFDEHVQLLKDSRTDYDAGGTAGFLANNAFTRETFMNAGQSGERLWGLVNRLVGRGEASDENVDRANYIARLNTALREDDWQPWLSKAFGTSVGSMTLMAGGGGSPTAMALAAGGAEANEAYVEGRDAGLRGEKLHDYVAVRGGVEGGVTMLFQRFGLGGAESAAASRGVASGLKPLMLNALKQIPAEILEENIIEATNVWTRHNYIDPEGDPQYGETLKDTTVATLFTMGMMHGPNMAGTALTEKQENAINRFMNPDIETAPPSRSDGWALPKELRKAGDIKSKEGRIELGKTLQELQGTLAQKKAEFEQTQQQAQEEYIAAQERQQPAESAVAGEVAQGETFAQTAPAAAQQPEQAVEGVQPEELVTQGQELPTQGELVTQPEAPEQKTRVLDVPSLANMTEEEVQALPKEELAKAAKLLKVKTGGLKPEAAAKKILAVKPEPYSVDAIQRTFETTAEEAEAVDALVTAAGLDKSRFFFGKGGKDAKADLKDSQRGVYQTLEGGLAVVRGLNNPNAVTAVHEVLGHGTRRMLFDKSIPEEQRAGVTDADIDAINDWVGNKGQKWTRKQEEQFARGMEKYLATGKAPNSKLKSVFQKVSDFFRQFYGSLVQMSQRPNFKGVNITPEVREVFDRLYQRGDVRPADVRQTSGETAQQAVSPTVEAPSGVRPASVERPAELGPSGLATQEADVSRVERPVREAADKEGIRPDQLQSIVNSLYERDLELYNSADQERRRELRQKYFRDLKELQGEDDYAKIPRFDEEAQEQGFESSEAFAEYLKQSPMQKPTKSGLVDEALDEYRQAEQAEVEAEATSFPFGETAAGAFFQEMDDAAREERGYADTELEAAREFFRSQGDLLSDEGLFPEQEAKEKQWVDNGVLVGLDIYDNGFTKKEEWKGAFKQEFNDVLSMSYGTEQAIDKYLNKVWKASAEGRRKINARNREVKRVGKAASGKATKQATSRAVKSQGRVQPAKEVVSDQRKLLNLALRKQQSASRKGKMVGSIEQNATTVELAELAGQIMPKRELGRVIGHIANARTPKQIERAVTAINKAALAHNWKVAKGRLDSLRKKALAKDSPLSAQEVAQVESLLDSLSFRKPMKETVRKARSLLEAAEQDNMGQIHQWQIEKARNVLDAVDKTNLDEVSPEELNSLSDEIEAIINMRLTKNRIRLQGKREEANRLETQISHAAQETMGRDHAGTLVSTQAESRKRDNHILSRLKDTLTFDQQNLLTMIKRLFGDNQEAHNVFSENLKRGDRESHRVERRMRERLTEISNRFSKQELRDMSAHVVGSKPGKTVNVKQHTLPSGKTIRLTGGELMSLYAHWNDPSTRAELLRNKQDGIVIGHNVKGSPVKLGANDFVALADKLTDKQKQAVEDIQRVIHENHAENVVPLMWEAFGNRVESREDHFPRRRRKSATEAAQGVMQSMHNSSLKYVQNMGLWKERTGGNDPIIVDDIFSVAFSQASATAVLQKAEAVNTARVMLNSERVQNAVKAGTKSGEKYLKALDYVLTQFAGLQSQEKTWGQDVVNQIRRNTAIYGLGGKVHVWLYQPVSLMAAATRIPLRHIVSGLGPRTADTIKEIETWSDKLVNRLTGQGHMIANPGYTGRMVQRFYGYGDTLADKAMKPISWMDRWAITKLWNAAKIEGQQQNLQGDELMEYTARRAEQLVDETQPTWDSLTSSLIVQKGRHDPILGLMTMFSSQRQKNANIAIQGVMDYARSEKNASDFIKLGRDTLAPTLIQAAFIAAIKQGFWDGVATAFGTDDDDDEEKLERYGDEVVRNTVGNYIVGGDLAFDAYSVSKGVVQGKPVRVHKSPPAELVESTINAGVNTGRAVSAASSGEVISSGPNVGSSKAWKHGKSAITEGLQAIGLGLGLPTGIVAQALYPFFDGGDKFANPHVQRIWSEGTLYNSLGKDIRDIEKGVKPNLIDDLEGLKEERAAREPEYRMKQSMDDLWSEYRKLMISGKREKAREFLVQMETRAEAYTQWKEGEGDAIDAFGPEYIGLQIYQSGAPGKEGDSQDLEEAERKAQADADFIKQLDIPLEEAEKMLKQKMLDDRNERARLKWGRSGGKPDKFRPYTQPSDSFWDRRDRLRERLK